MNKISPLGIFCIAFFIQQWNACNKTDRKNTIREVFVNGNKTHGFKLMQCLINEQLMFHQCSINGLSLWQDVFETLAAFMVPAPENDRVYGTSFHQDATKVRIKAKIEVTLYFESVFEQSDQFEQIRMPEFSLKNTLPFPGDGKPDGTDTFFSTGGNFCAGAPDENNLAGFFEEEQRFGPREKE